MSAASPSQPALESRCPAWMRFAASQALAGALKLHNCYGHFAAVLRPFFKPFLALARAESTQHAIDLVASRCLSATHLAKRRPAKPHRAKLRAQSSLPRKRLAHVSCTTDSPAGRPARKMRPNAHTGAHAPAHAQLNAANPRLASQESRVPRSLQRTADGASASAWAAPSTANSTPMPPHASAAAPPKAMPAPPKPDRSRCKATPKTGQVARTWRTGWKE